MPARIPSPALSENEVDISNALFGNDSDSDRPNGTTAKRKALSAEAPTAELGAASASSSDDDEDFIATAQLASNRKASNVKGRSVKKGGGFQAMGLGAALLKAVARKGFAVPTPIQRKAIPLVLAGRDVVGMARTGSGKTAAFVVPLIERLKSHSARVGARALVLSPSRELALQTLRVVRELGRGTDLRCVLLVGGDSLEEQFGMMASNPDVVIATPGRFLHLKVEMGLDLSSMGYVVFDEADRLFEMGFADQLREILHALPPTRQTLLFSATLPKSLVEFARAGLQDPCLVRLDADSKISPDLRSAFFTVKTAEKEGALLHILHDVIKIPTGMTEAALAAKEEESKASKKRKRTETGTGNKESPTEHSTIIFTATKHHVEYIAALLRLSGFATSHVYGALDQTARKLQVQDFRTGMTNILVVTDVAARGIDIPILANVINYDFPAQPKIYVHRVGRTARAGQKGWSYSLVRDADAPYLLDLQLFLGRPLLLGREGREGKANFAADVVGGSLRRDGVESHSEWVTKTLEDDIDIEALKSVTLKAEKLYLRTRPSASSESAKRTKEVAASTGWTEVHPLFDDADDKESDGRRMELEREKMLARVSGFRPSETIFELGKRGGQLDQAGDVVRKRRSQIQAKKEKAERAKSKYEDDDVEMADVAPNGIEQTDSAASDDDEAFEEEPDQWATSSTASSDDLEVTTSAYFSSADPIQASASSSHSKPKPKTLRDAAHYMSYTPAAHNPSEDRAYTVDHTSAASSFTAAARSATLDLGADDVRGFGEASRPDYGQRKRWDKKSKKYVSAADAASSGSAKNRDAEGNKKKFIRSESGGRIAASFKSGRFDAWRAKHRVGKMPRVGEQEAAAAGGGARFGGGGPGGDGGRRFAHKQAKMPKRADRLRDDFHKQRKKVEAARERAAGVGGLAAGGGGGGREGRKGKVEIKSAQDVRKARAAKERRREKTARPSRKGKR